MKKLDEFITNSIEARRDDKTVPIIRVVADYSTTFRLWELAVVDYNTCGMTKKELFSNYFCVGGESGEGEGHIAGFGSTAIFTLTRGTHPFFVASQSHLSNDAYCVNGGLQDDPVTHQAYTYIELSLSTGTALTVSRFVFAIRTLRWFWLCPQFLRRQHR